MNCSLYDLNNYLPDLFYFNWLVADYLEYKLQC